MDKQNVYVRTIKYYSAIKRNKVLTRAAAWINLKMFMLTKKLATEDRILYDPLEMECPN